MDELQPKWLRSTKGVPFTGIGSLEADILAIVWESDRVTVRDVYETLRSRRKIAYTTVMTVMNNLVKKHLLNQDKSNIAYVYTPAISGHEVAYTILDSVVQRLLAGRPNLAGQPHRPVASAAGSGGTGRPAGAYWRCFGRLPPGPHPPRMPPRGRPPGAVR